MTTMERIELAFRRAKAKAIADGVPTPLINLLDRVVEELMVEAKETAAQRRQEEIHNG